MIVSVCYAALGTAATMNYDVPDLVDELARIMSERRAADDLVDELVTGARLLRLQLARRLRPPHRRPALRAVSRPQLPSPERRQRVRPGPWRGCPVRYRST